MVSEEYESNDIDSTDLLTSCSGVDALDKITPPQLVHLEKVFSLSIPTPELSGLKRNARGLLVQEVPNRRRQKPRETVFVAPLFPINPPHHFVILPNTDPRYTLPNLLHHCFVIGDMEKFRRLLVENCIPNLQFINQCDGMQNPYGPMTRELYGASNLADYQTALLATSPDLIAKQEDYRAHVDPLPYDPITQTGGCAFVSYRAVSSSTRLTCVVHSSDDSQQEIARGGYSCMQAEELLTSSSAANNLVGCAESLVGVGVAEDSDPSRTDSCGGQSEAVGDTFLMNGDTLSGIRELLAAGNILPLPPPLDNSRFNSNKRNTATPGGGFLSDRFISQKKKIVTPRQPTALEQVTASMERFTLAPIRAPVKLGYFEAIYTCEFNAEGKIFRLGVLFKYSS